MGFPAYPIQTNFTAGEVSPLIRGRVDLDRYFNGVEILENFIVRPQGGIFRRSGTRFIVEVKNSNKQVILQEFEFSIIQAYILEFGHEYIRILKDGGIVEDPPGTSVEVATPYQESDLSKLWFTQSADILYICHPDYQTRKLSRTSHTSWTLSLLETTDGPYLPENNDIDNKITVSNVVDRATLKSTANDFVVGDVGKYVEYDKDGQKVIGLIISYIAADEVVIEPKENIVAELDKEVTIESIVLSTLTASHSVFHRGNIGSFIRAYPTGAGTNGWYNITGYDGQTPDQLTVNATPLTLVSTSGTLTLSDRTITADLESVKDTFVSTDINRHIRMKFNGQQVWAIITAYTDEKNVSVELQRFMPLKETDSTTYEADGITDLWRLGAWSETTGWPSKVVIHEQRLTFANTSEEPQTIWMSRTADYENFSPTEEDSTVLDDNAITYTIASNKVNTIQWMSSAAVLLIGTTGGEWQIKASTISEPITPTNIVVTQQAAHGAVKDVRSEAAGNAIFFIQRSGRELMELMYNFEVDSYLARDMTIISEHILRDGNKAIDVAYQKAPNSIIWVLREDGQLAALTYNNEQRVFAWHRHIFGGVFGSGNAVVESISAVPSINGTENSLYLVVKRTINGSTKRYIEYLEVDFHPEDPTNKDDMFFIDSGLSYDGVPVTTISGLDHLEGETVNVLADGAVIPDRVVSSGEIVLDDAASKVSVGLNYESLVKTLPIEIRTSLGTAQGKIKRVHQLTIRLLDSLGFLHGSDVDNLIERSFRKSSDPMDDSPDLFTGDITFNLEQSYDMLANYFIKQEKPYPLTIIALMPELRVGK